MGKRDAPLSVTVPETADDHPVWGRAGIIAAAGFALGIAWPRLAGTRLAPNPPAGAIGTPSEATSAAPASSEPAPSRAAPGAISSAAPAASAPAVASAAPPAAVAISVGHGTVIRCRDDQGDEVSPCDGPPLDPIAVPRIRELAQCPAAAGASGKLSLGLDIDFHRRSVRVLKGKKTTLADSIAQGLVRCASSAFDKAPLFDVRHEQRRYAIYYAADFATAGSADSSNGGAARSVAPAAASAANEPSNTPPETAPAAGAPVQNETPISGTATVAWSVAVLRDAPKTGSIVGRAHQGAKAKLVGRQRDWYHVKVNGAEGWVWRGAVGM